jgi:hypothetical protein
MANRPIKKWRSGSIEGCIWLNKKKLDDGSEVEFKTISLSRSFKKKDDDIWRSEIINCRKGDIPKIQVVLHNLQQELFLTEEKEKEEEE